MQLLLLDTPEFVAAYFGILRAGCVAVPTNTWLLPKDYAYYLEYARPQGGDRRRRGWPALAPVLARRAAHHADCDRRRSQRRTVPEGTIDWHPSWPAQPAVARTEPTYRDDFATWLLDVGLDRQAQVRRCTCTTTSCGTRSPTRSATLGLTRDDITLSAPKLFFGYALGQNLLFPLASAAAACCSTSGVDARRATSSCIERYRPTQFVTVPTTIAKMLEPPSERASAATCRALRSLISAGEALPAALYQRWKEASAVEIYDGIGSAEMFHIYITNRPGDVKEGCLGKIVEGYRYAALRRRRPRGRRRRDRHARDQRATRPALGYWRMRDKSRADLPRRLRSWAATSSRSTTMATSGSAAAATTC